MLEIEIGDGKTTGGRSRKVSYIIASRHPCVDDFPLIVIVMRLLAASFERVVENGERLDPGYLEQTPPDRRVTRPRRAAELEDQQPLVTVLDAVVVRFNDANRAAIADLDQPPVRDGESNPRTG
jgi:hypothetical protein